MSEIRILGVYVETKGQLAQQVQEILTKYGCSIRTRLGIHTPETNSCKSCGLILLELTGNADECLRLENELWALDGVKIQKMVF